MLTQDRRVTPRVRGLILGLFVLIATGLSGCPWSAAALGVPAGSIVPSPIVPSPETTAFLAAYSRGDEALADSLASPLYRAEWGRLGLSAEERTQIAAPGHRQGEPLQERLRFTYVDEVSDAEGFGHLLFSARSTRTDRLPLSTAWRVDVDPDGRVIWLEMVWLFKNDVQAVRPVLDLRELSEVTPTLPGVPPLFGVAAVDGREAYYAFGLSANDPGGSTSRPPTLVGFYAVDSDGQVRPGAWTFGQSGDGLAEYGKPRPVHKDWNLEPKDLAVLSDYLDSLG